MFSIDGGTRAGTNLFHSFSQFSLGAGDTAAWTRSAGDAAAIRNVISRVTGGQPSQIAGTLDSTALPNADFYFINPAGIVFGAGAQVNVPAAAYFSTAGELRLADGSKFSAATPTGSTLSVAAPESFGFVGGQGAISIDGALTTFAPVTSNLSLSAANVAVTNSQIVARGLDIVTVGDRVASYRLADPLATTPGGVLSLQGSRLNAFTTDAPGAPLRLVGGDIRIGATGLVSVTLGKGRGGDLTLKGGHVAIAPDALIVTSASGAGAGGDILVNAGVIDVDARGATTTTGFTSVATGDGGAGGVSLLGDAIRFTGETGNPTGSGMVFIGSTILGKGNAGDVVLSAKDLTLDFALLSSSSIGAGNGGNIRITAANQELGGSLVLTSAFGDGRPGAVRIDGDKIAISGGQFGAVPGARQATGGLVIAATTSLVAQGGRFSAVSASPTSSGTVTLRAPFTLLSQSTIDTQAYFDGLAGQVLLDADTLLLDRIILTSNSSDGPLNTGLVRLQATGKLVLFQGQYTATVGGASNGGRIEVSGGDVQVDGALIQTDTDGFGTGDAGQISITATGTLGITNAAVISSNTATVGRGGLVTLAGRDIRIDNAAAVTSDSTFLSATGFPSDTSTEGNAGGIQIRATGNLALDSSSVSSRAKEGTGNAGSIRIDAGRLTMTDAIVSSESDSLGRAGTVDVRADQIDLDGANRGFTGISSDSFGFGDAGSVTLQAKSVTVRSSAFISSTGLRDGRGGDVTIRTGDLSVLDGGAVLSVGTQTDGGNISIVATGTVAVTSNPSFFSFISSAATGGNAGNLSLEAGTLVVDGGAVSSDTFGPGNAGNLRIKAGAIVLNGTAAISSSTGSFGNAGTLTIDAGSINLGAGTQILSAATTLSQGDAGSITVHADTVSLAKDATITTSTGGPGNAGRVDITSKSLRIDGGEVSSQATVGSTGAAGDVRLAVGELAIVNAGVVSTLSSNANKAGELRVTADRITVDGPGSVVSSANIADGRGDAGEIFLTANNVRIANGGGVTTNSTAGAAGGIDIRIADPGLLVLEGSSLPGVISTSSGPGRGGAITILTPEAIISNGGRILALGQQRGANVQIASTYFINSSDRRNVVDVAGDFRLQAGLYDVSSGTVTRDLSVLDASKVLQGQCPIARSTGVVSQLITRPVGPYVRDPGFAAPPPRPAAPNLGACP